MTLMPCIHMPLGMWIYGRLFINVYDDFDAYFRTTVVNSNIHFKKSEHYSWLFGHNM